MTGGSSFGSTSPAQQPNRYSGEASQPSKGNGHKRRTSAWSIKQKKKQVLSIIVRNRDDPSQPATKKKERLNYDCDLELKTRSLSWRLTDENFR